MQIQAGVQLNPHHSSVGQGVLQTLQKGSIQCQEATMRTTNLRLTDIGEELTLHFSETIGQKDPAEHDIRRETQLQIMRVEEIIQCLTAAKTDETPVDLVALAERMLAAHQGPGQIARQTTANPTRHLLLSAGQREEDSEDGNTEGSADNVENNSRPTSFQRDPS